MKKKITAVFLTLFCFAALTQAVGISLTTDAPAEQAQSIALDGDIDVNLDFDTSCSEWLTVGSGSRCVVYFNGGCQCTEYYDIQMKHCSDGSSQSREVNHNTQCQ